jgi:hypothetical protein
MTDEQALLLWDTTWPDAAKEMIKQQATALAEKDAEIASLREALQPFADAAADLDDSTPDHCDMWEHHVAMAVSAGDFRRALAKHGGNNG